MHMLRVLARRRHRSYIIDNSSIILNPSSVTFHHHIHTRFLDPSNSFNLSSSQRYAKLKREDLAAPEADKDANGSGSGNDDVKPAKPKAQPKSRKRGTAQPVKSDEADAGPRKRTKKATDAAAIASSKSKKSVKAEDNSEEEERPARKMGAGAKVKAEQEDDELDFNQFVHGSSGEDQDAES